MVSIHAPRVGCDSKYVTKQFRNVVSIHAPRVGCDYLLITKSGEVRIVSIHAPRVGCDIPFLCQEVVPGDVSIHAPRVGCDTKSSEKANGSEMFQFTHPVWGATLNHGSMGDASGFNSRTPCGVRPSMVLTASIYSRSFNSRTPCGVRQQVV